MWLKVIDMTLITNVFDDIFAAPAINLWMEINKHEVSETYIAV